MSNDPFDLDRPDRPIYGLKGGVVIDNSDPLGIGRVRIRIDGLIDDGTGWALPLGTVSGGERGRGFFSVPKVGSEVGVLFEGGDPDSPYYLAGNWGRPSSGRDVPTAVSDAPVSDAPDVHAFETDNFELVFDDRATNQEFRAKHKATGTKVSINGLTGALEIDALSNIKIEAVGTVEINGLTVTINGIVAGSGQL